MPFLRNGKLVKRAFVFIIGFCSANHIILLSAAGYPARGRTIEFARFEDRIKKIKSSILSSVHHCTAICFNLVEINKLMLARQNNNFKKVFGIKIRFYHFISCAPYTSLLFLDQLIRVLNTIPKKEKLFGLREKYKYYIKNCIKYSLIIFFDYFIDDSSSQGN